jgi:hypothetical protein
MQNHSSNMSTNKGSTGPVDEELGKPLEDSLAYLVDNSNVHYGAQKDQLARE